MAVKNQVQLITYPDSLGGDLKTLNNVLTKYFPKTFKGGIHILPPFPSSGDRGFAPLTYLEIEPQFGTWEDIRKLAENYDEFEELPAIFPISGLTKQGLATLLDATAELLDKTPEFLLYDESDMEEEAYYGFDEEEKAFEISRDDDATWVLSGEKLMKLFNMTNFDRDEAVMKFARQLRGMGVDEALRARGAKDGDLVRIGKFEFEFVD